MHKKGVQWMLQMQQAFTTGAPTAQVSIFVHCYTDVLWGDHHVGHLLFVPLCPLSTLLPVLCLWGLT